MRYFFFSLELASFLVVYPKKEPAHKLFFLLFIPFAYRQLCQVHEVKAGLVEQYPLSRLLVVLGWPVSVELVLVAANRIRDCSHFTDGLTFRMISQTCHMVKVGQVI